MGGRDPVHQLNGKGGRRAAAGPSSAFDWPAKPMNHQHDGLTRIITASVLLLESTNKFLKTELEFPFWTNHQIVFDNHLPLLKIENDVEAIERELQNWPAIRLPNREQQFFPNVQAPFFDKEFV